MNTPSRGIAVDVIEPWSDGGYRAVAAQHCDTAVFELHLLHRVRQLAPLGVELAGAATINMRTLAGDRRRG